jgi:hypothetical protein
MTREVSCWCPETAERIAEGGIEIAFRPHELLKRIAAERQWDAVKSAEWALGTMDWYDHLEVVHPAYAVVSGNSREIRNRLWRAQLEVLFPVLNSVRIAFAQQYPELLQNLVFQDDGKLCLLQGAKTLNPLDIDIGPMVHWLTTQRSNRLSGPQLQLLRAVAEIRNCLAHCRPISGWKGMRTPLIDVFDSGLELRRSQFITIGTGLTRGVRRGAGFAAVGTQSSVAAVFSQRGR